MGRNVKAIEEWTQTTTLETLIPDFKPLLPTWGSDTLPGRAKKWFPTIWETVKDLTREVAFQSENMQRSLSVFLTLKKTAPIVQVREINVGLGRKGEEEVIQTQEEPRSANVDVVTIGQIGSLKKTISGFLKEYYFCQKQLKKIEEIGTSTGFRHVEKVGHWLRSSYKATQTHKVG